MRIVIEVDGDKLTTVRPEGAVPVDLAADFPEPVSSAPPASLLERAKQLGALSAGPAHYGTGAALAAAAPAGEAPKLGGPPKRNAARKTRGRTRRSS